MIADTSAWIEMLRATGSPVANRLQQLLRKGQMLLMPDVVYHEVLQGCANAQQFMRLQAQLDLVPAFAPDDPRETARQAAILYARCRWQGITIRSPNHCLIAACAVEADEPLLHADRDFERIAEVEPRLRLA
jgi:hypothetical protein